jgi:hypothetical protein
MWEPVVPEDGMSASFALVVNGFPFPVPTHDDGRKKRDHRRYQSREIKSQSPCASETIVSFGFGSV